MRATPEQIAAALATESDSRSGNPALVLLRANSRYWVLPLFAKHLEDVEWVSAEWFHERVQESLDEVGPDPARTPADYCREWAEKRWLNTNVVDGRLVYQLTAHSLRVLQFVRELIEGSTTVSGARLNSIAHAVQLLADMTNPDREKQKKSIDDQIKELQRKKAQIDAGARLATTEEMQQQLREILTMIRSLPADFRQLRTMVEDRHQQIARQAMVKYIPKGTLVETYLYENDLLAETSEGKAYLGFANLLASGGADQILTDTDRILAQDFAQEHMSADQRDSFTGILTNLLDADHEVSSSYVRWSGSLRRFLTRAVGAQQHRLASLADRALHAGSEWAGTAPTRQSVPLQELLGVGVLDIRDVSQTQLWRDHGPQEVVIEIAQEALRLPTSDRAALRLASGTSTRAMGRIINRLLTTYSSVTAADVFDATPEEFRRLGAVVSLLDLAIAHGDVGGIDQVESVRLAGDKPYLLITTLPYLTFDSPIPVKETS